MLAVIRLQAPYKAVTICERKRERIGTSISALRDRVSTT
jgi:hypothetical protein